MANDLGLQTGDVVLLKSGGAAMTIAETDGRLANCVWHDADGHLQTATLGLQLLQKAADTSNFNKPISYPSRGYT
jgi:uncharacterized protein YodC (DUF2158 family)